VDRDHEQRIAAEAAVIEDGSASALARSLNELVERVARS
jgi:hypothetical protein